MGEELQVGVLSRKVLERCHCLGERILSEQALVLQAQVQQRENLVELGVFLEIEVPLHDALVVALEGAPREGDGGVDALGVAAEAENVFDHLALRKMRAVLEEINHSLL